MPVESVCGAVMATDAPSVRALWSFHANQWCNASSMTYEFDRRQDVAVAAGPTIIAFESADDNAPATSSR